MTSDEQVPIVIEVGGFKRLAVIGRTGHGHEPAPRHRTRRSRHDPSRNRQRDQQPDRNLRSSPAAQSGRPPNTVWTTRFFIGSSRSRSKTASGMPSSPRCERFARLINSLAEVRTIFQLSHGVRARGSHGDLRIVVSTLHLSSLVWMARIAAQLKGLKNRTAQQQVTEGN